MAIKAQISGPAYRELIEAVHDVRPPVIDVAFDGGRDKIATTKIEFALTEDALEAWGRRLNGAKQPMDEGLEARIQAAVQRAVDLTVEAVKDQANRGGSFARALRGRR